MNRRSTETTTDPTTVPRTVKTRSQWLRMLDHCHSALTAYGEQRLHASGWRELGVGSLPAASPAFQTLALDAATGWATYEARDSLGETIADIAARQPHWFSPDAVDTIDALAASRLDVYVVESDGTPATTLRRLSDDRLLTVDASSPNHVTPSGATLIARVVVEHDRAALLSAAVVTPSVTPLPPDRDTRSRFLVEALMRKFAGIDLEGRGSSLEPRLCDVPLRELARLHRALKSLELTLDHRAPRLARHQTIDGRALLAERRRDSWRIVVIGPEPAAVERVPVRASHPLDAEMMRQIGATSADGVLSFDGAVKDLVEVCAGAAVARARRAA